MIEPPSHVRIEAWVDPVVDALGFDPKGPYLEFVALPRLGPAACWCLRRLTSGLSVQPGGYECSVPDLSAELGLGTGAGRHSHIAHTLSRLEVFGLLRPVGPDTYQVRRVLSPLTEAQLSRLPASARRAHALLVDRRDRGRQVHPAGREAKVSLARRHVPDRGLRQERGLER
ncbi:MAG: hypothetical protein ACRD0J_03655 [Acidimicrobiales bacterium]